LAAASIRDVLRCCWYASTHSPKNILPVYQSIKNSTGSAYWSRIFGPRTRRVCEIAVL
jgi:hypothetical protein